MSLAKYVPLLAVCAALSCMSGAAAAADAYPAKPIRLVIPTAPGGGMDLIGRLVAQVVGEQLGQQIVVDNRSGAGTMIGSEVVARSAPDGYTVLLVNMAFTANPALYKHVPYDPLTSFAPVALLASLPSVLVMHPSVQVASVRELVTLARNRPGALNYGSAGTGTSLHLISELFKSVAAVNIVHVPYNGAGPAIVGLLSGEVALTFVAVPPVFQYVQQGRLRALGVTSARRLAAIPDVPTIAESGLPRFEANDWQAIVAPVGTPDAVIAKLNREILGALNAPQVKDRIATLGAQATGSTPHLLREHIDKELALWARVIKTAAIQGS